jgi:hypothetical protein
VDTSSEAPESVKIIKPNKIAITFMAFPQVLVMSKKSLKQAVGEETHGQVTVDLPSKRFAESSAGSAKR